MSSEIILDLQHSAVCDFVKQQTIFSDPAHKDSRLPIVLLSVLAMFMRSNYIPIVHDSRMHARPTHKNTIFEGLRGLDYL